MINTFFTETLPMNTRTRNLTRTSSNACENNTKTLHATYLRRTSSSILLTLFMGVMLLFFIQTSFAQTFSGGSGTQGDPYRISTPSDLVELSAITNVNDGIATVGQYFELTNNIDMASVSGFVPIGVTTQNPNRTTHYFCGNFDGKNFALKNLSIVDTVSFSQQNTALFGDVKGARITNLLLDNAFFSSKVRVSAFVGTAIDSLYMDNCIALSCTMEGNTISGFISSGVSSITNCRVVNAKMEGYTIMGFCGTAYSGTQISNSSVRYSTLIGEASVAGFATSVPSASNCYVSNCVLSGNYIGGFVYMTSNAEIDNCGVQAVLMKTTALSSASGFAWWCGGMGTTERISNSYDACEFTGIDNNHDYDYPFGAGAANGSTVILTNCYTKTDPNLPVGNYNSDVVSKSDSYLKSAAMVAHPGTLDNSLNYGQSSPAWKEDFSPHPINKGYPILAWVQPFSYVSTYPVTDLTSVSATLQGLTFAEGEGIIAEHGFQWRG
ncbi:MAG: hypothetical protein FWH36_04675, partial [Lentimicrobiaceae bacterium]|nr:hypothetical protein [Lentimicrobiaceae bacterium]